MEYSSESITYSPLISVIADAKNNLRKLVKAAMRGEQVILTNRGKRVAELVRTSAKKKGFGSRPGLTASLPPGWDSIAESEKYVALFENLPK